MLNPTLAALRHSANFVLEPLLVDSSSLTKPSVEVAMQASENEDDASDEGAHLLVSII